MTSLVRRLWFGTYPRLVAWVKKHYRETLSPADPLLREESRRALDALTRLLGLGPLYPFQQT